MDFRQSLATAIAHHQAGRLDAAEAIYRNILSVAPSHADSLHLLGVIANQRGQHETAIDLIGQAIRLKKSQPAAEFHNNLADALRTAGQPEKAIHEYKRAVSLKPGYLAARNNLGAVFLAQGRLDEAAEAFRAALTLKPDNATALYGLGSVFHERRRLVEAKAYYEQALAIRSDYPEAHNNLATVLAAEDDIDGALAHYRRALELRPNYASAHYNFGIVLAEQGRLQDAIAHYEQALAFAPGNAETHWNLALAHLLRGEFIAGWEGYEWRLRGKSFPARNFAEPLWQGGDLAGRTILLHAEQGYGDTIQFIRYARLVKQSGAEVIVECQPGLDRLLQDTAGIDRVVAQGEPLPPFDCHAPLLSLPHRFRTVVETIPGKAPYLHPQPDLVAAWRGRLSHLTRPKIGLVWRGSPQNAINHRKSIPADIAAELCGDRNFHWIGLQKDATGDEIDRFPHGVEIASFTPDLTDWAETAALVSCLDLVVTVDTAMAHLMGALGRPALVLLSHVPDWRWLLDRADSHWYPSLRLIRQTSPGDWNWVIAEARSLIPKFVAPAARNIEPVHAR